MADFFSKYYTNLNDPAEFAYVVTPNDSTDLAVSSRFLWIGVGGNLRVELVGDPGTTVDILNIASGTRLPIRASRVHSTGTSASSILACY